MDTANHQMAQPAAQAYAIAHSEALAKIESLREMIEALPAPETVSINWGHVGSLGHINNELDAIIGFVE